MSTFEGDSDCTDTLLTISPKKREPLLEYEVAGIVQDMRNKILTLEKELNETLRGYDLVMTLERSAEDRSEKPYDTVRKLLDDGANPNFHIFRLLIAKGANINGPPITITSKLSGPYLPLHVPACAAALAIAEGPGEDLSLMQLCLDHGADLKARVPFVRNFNGYMKIVSFITPLAIYLDRAICDWTEKPGPDSGEEATDTSGDPSHVDMVSFLLTNGARSPDLVLPMEPNPGEIQCEGPYQFQPARVALSETRGTVA
ncbi:hypothetical protein QBC37DRAFT_398815 [Rhypophila decipiens]|uniref:Uncharacterized protein n=1 Tax=Rhypophila decipiens TaxID=261697 RepID=A0AAN7B8Y2_9PEZI|nr:hypothetical protein QBC37DRAFT_398815 [Rhypophila decipiens]